jgi:uncharacterized membrane protein YjgN (DUF898 family)
VVSIRRGDLTPAIAGIAVCFFPAITGPVSSVPCPSPNGGAQGAGTPDKEREVVREDSLKGDHAMTVIDLPGAAATLPPPPPLGPVRLRFTGRNGDYWRLMIRGALLQTITLGIYRFWLFTDMRRFLWAGTRGAGETPEYTGTAAELLIGFLFAIGLLIPVYALFFVGSLELGLVSRLSGVGAFIVLAGFSEYAGYRARRYRLTRTVFRGIRFHQTGSAVLYALRAMLWWIPVALTFGIVWPWAMANLERCKMRNTFYGNLGGGFAGSGARLFRQGVLLWFLAAGPLAAGLAGAAFAIDWTVVADAWELDDLRSVFDLLKDDKSLKAAIGALVAGAIGTAVMGALLYPAYQAIVMRWWLGGLRVGGAAVASDLRVGSYYLAYVLYLAFVMVFSIAFTFVVSAAVFGVSFGMRSHGIDFSRPNPLLQGAVAGVFGIAYIIYLMGTYTIYQVVVKLELWRAAVESVVISGYAAFDHVQADEAASSAFGEGLADALGSGGF